jgi:hypothetical protein
MLLRLVKRLGLRKAARRIGLNPRTVQKAFYAARRSNKEPASRVADTVRSSGRCENWNLSQFRMTHPVSPRSFRHRVPQFAVEGAALGILSCPSPLLEEERDA